MPISEVQHALAARDKRRLSEILQQNWGMTVDVSFYDLCIPYGFILNTENGRTNIGFGLQLTDGPGEMAILGHRLCEIMPLLKIVCGNRLSQTVWNLSDTGPDFHISFCSNKNALLIPDNEFVSGKAYVAAKATFCTRPSWEDRNDIPFWRGSTTGLRNGQSVQDLPRVKLCRLARNVGYNAYISGVVQFNDDDKKSLMSENIIRDAVHWSELSKNRFNIDIDGNSSAWSGLFLKLLAGGVVMKVNSAFGFRQWFYDRLVPWLNFVPVQSDLSDLTEVVEKLRSDPANAEAIGRRGRELALSLTYDRELAEAEEKIFKHAGVFP